jgi:hypothetical protein
MLSLLYGLFMVTLLYFLSLFVIIQSVLELKEFLSLLMSSSAFQLVPLMFTCLLICGNLIHRVNMAELSVMAFQVRIRLVALVNANLNGLL